MKPGDKVIIYSGRHYGRLHRIIEIVARVVKAIQVDSGDLVTVPVCDCELVGGAK